MVMYQIKRVLIGALNPDLISKSSVDDTHNLPCAIGKTVTDFVVTVSPSNGSSIRSSIPEDISSSGITIVDDDESWNVPPLM